MRIQVKTSALKQTKWYEYAIRFLFGGLLTALTGLITARYGPVIGGLFLAFPSIFPASVTLVQKHKAEKEQQKGQGEQESLEKGKDSAHDTAFGTSLGSFGLLTFGLVIWQLSTVLSPWLVLLIALAAWFVTGVLIWWLVVGRKNKQDSAGQD